MHLVWFPCISCMEFRPPWSDFHTLAWKSDSSIPAWCGSADFNNRVLVLMVSYFQPFIVILIYLPILKHLNIQKIIFLWIEGYCQNIACYPKLVSVLLWGLSAARTTLCAAETESYPHLQESHLVSHMEAPCFCRQIWSTILQRGIIGAPCSESTLTSWVPPCLCFFAEL